MLTAQSVTVPRIWDDAALADWATPVAGLNVRPSNYTSAEYYAVPGDNLRTYPVYPPDKEPPGYWEWLQKQKPQPLVDATKIRNRQDWIEAGERAFHDLGSLVVRTNDPTLIAQARNPSGFQGVRTLSDGGVVGPRWVVTSEVPTLRGVWDRQLLLHDGAIASLAELFDPARLDPTYVSNGWNPPDRARRGVPGHVYGLKLGPEDKAALIAFLRSL